MKYYLIDPTAKMVKRVDEETIKELLEKGLIEQYTPDWPMPGEMWRLSEKGKQVAAEIFDKQN